MVQQFSLPAEKVTPFLDCHPLDPISVFSFR